MNTTDEKFKPTVPMNVWIDTAIELMTDNITEISDNCNVSRQSWYRWVKLDGFLEWFRDEWQKRLSTLGWKLDVIGMKNASKSHSYWRSMQERIGNLPISRDSLDTPCEVIIKDYVSDSDKKKIEVALNKIYRNQEIDDDK